MREPFYPDWLTNFPPVVEDVLLYTVSRFKRSPTSQFQFWDGGLLFRHCRSLSLLGSLTNVWKMVREREVSLAPANPNARTKYGLGFPESGLSHSRWFLPLLGPKPAVPIYMKVQYVIIMNVFHILSYWPDHQTVMKILNCTSTRTFP